MAKRQIILDWRRALKLLASSANGCTEEFLFAHGFTDATIAGLLDTGVVAATTKRVLAGQCNGPDVTRFMITGRGRAALKRVRVPVLPNERDERGRLMVRRRD
jgi:hypothetical protein